MSDWKKTTIGEVAEFITTGKTPSTKNDTYFGGDVQWFTPPDVGQTKYLRKSNRTITNNAIREGGAQSFPKGTLLVTCIGNIGRVGILFQDSFCNQQITAIRFKGFIDVNYAYYWFHKNSNLLRQRANQAVVPILNNSLLKEIDFHFPPLNIQQQIAAILEKADAAREKRRQANRLTEQFLQSAFLEMFGDPATNPKGWEVVSIDDISIHVSSGSTPLGGQSTYLKEGILFIRSQNVLMNQLDYSDIAHISPEVHHQMKRTWVKNGDVLLNITGASIGRVCYFKGDNDAANVNQHVCIIRPSVDRALPEYLSYFISMPSYQNVILARNSGATRQAFTFEQIRKFRINLPPLSEQQKFAVLVEKVESLRSKQRQSEQELEHLFHSLAQRAFRGELVGE